MNTQEINDKLSIFIDGIYENEGWLFKCMNRPVGKSSPDFHKDWNWLMKVIDKIEHVHNMQYSFKFNSHKTEIISILDPYDPYTEDLLFATGGCDFNENGQIVLTRTKIESAYETCSDFIDWFNDLEADE